MEATAVVIIVGLALGAIILAVLLSCCVYRWDTLRPSSSPSRPNPDAPAANRLYNEVQDDEMRNTTINNFLARMNNEWPIRFTAEQLVGYTNNYSTQLGRGGFGTVYKGVLPNSLAVAVKVLDGGLGRLTMSKKQFMAEMETVGRTNHINLVRLYGFCSQGATHALVYEFMEHGALGDYLSAARRDNGVTSMATVAEIATGVAKGLKYLHEECQPKILHLDIKPANVLLDGRLRPKVADFGLARLVNRAGTHVSVSCAGGTPVYVPPEVALDHDMRLTDKCDVYSFGVLLLSIVGRGKRNWDRQGFPMTVWTRYAAGELMDLVGRHGTEDEQRRRRTLAERMCKVAFWCVQRNPGTRPSMSDVVQMLQGELNIPPPPNPFQYLNAAPAANQEDNGERLIVTVCDS